MFSGTLAVGMGAWESAFYAFYHGDAMGKSIVVMLLLGSIVTWTIMLDKGLSLRKAGRLSEKFIEKFKKFPLLTDGKLYSGALRDSGPIARVYCAGATRLLNFYGSPDGRTVPPAPLTGTQREVVRTALENAVSEQTAKLEERISKLALAVSVSPLCGLFGTVWGVMAAFCGAAVAGRADIAALAPGISGALLTTVVGLIVAIPSLVGYNILSDSIGRTATGMDDFVEEFMARLSIEQMELEREALLRNPPPPPPMATAAYEQAQVVMPLRSVLMAQGGRTATAAAEKSGGSVETASARPGATQSPLEPSFTVDGASGEDTGRRQNEMPFGDGGF